MPTLNNLSIGTKLAIIPIVAIAMVLGMTVGQVIGNNSSDAAQLAASREQTIAYQAAEAKASTRGMAIGVRDIRLARTPARLKSSHDYVNARLAALVHHIEPMVATTTHAESRDVMLKLKVEAERYAAIALEMVQLKNQIPELEGKSDAAGIAVINA